MRILEVQNEIVDEFSLFEDWMQRYEYMIELGKSIDLIDPSKKIDSNLIKGCQSKLWLDAELKDDKLFFKADSEAIITKGFLNLFFFIDLNKISEKILNGSPATINIGLVFIDLNFLSYKELKIGIFISGSCASTLIKPFLNLMIA